MGDMYLAWAKDKGLEEKGECGGAVSAILKSLLESGRVDAVLTVKARNGNRYDGIPVVITRPEDVAETAGALHCFSGNLARCLKEYLDGALQIQLAVVGRPCDIRAIIELCKRNKIKLDNLVLIGLNCTGTLPASRARKMFAGEFGVNPEDVVREDIDEGKLKIWLKDGSEKEMDLADLEKKGYGRRENCQRCDVNIPTMADLACGKWGAEDKGATFIEVCSGKGAEVMEAAIKAGFLRTEEPSREAIAERKRKDEQAIADAQKAQERDFSEYHDMTIDDRFAFWKEQFNQCIKCYGCRDACPICYCDECVLQPSRELIPAGVIPPGWMFSMIRAFHVADSCINCGQCQDTCPMGLPLSRLIFMLNREIDKTLNYEPGLDAEQRPPLVTFDPEEMRNDGVKMATLPD
jgi:formate dehydrogenase subunit beta